MIVLLTGANGFVGSYLRRYLTEAGIKVVILTKTKEFNEGITWNDLNNESFKVDSDVIIHLAGKAHDIDKSEKEEEYMNVNFGLTKIIFQKFINSNANTFIFFSSIKAVTDELSDGLNENALPNPGTPYGKSKLACEQFILSYNLPLDKRVYILRPCLINGPGVKGNLRLLYNFGKSGFPYPLGAFNNKRSFLFIGNLAYLIEKILWNKIPSGVYNISDDEPLEIKEVIQILENSLEKRIKILNISPYLIRSFSKIGDLLGFRINTRQILKLTQNLVVENDKIKKALNIQKLPFSVREGIRETFKKLD